MFRLEPDTELTPREMLAVAVDTTDLYRADEIAATAKRAGSKIIKLGLELNGEFRPRDCAEFAARHELEWVADQKITAATMTMMPAIETYLKLDHPPIGITVDTNSGFDSLQLAQKLAAERGIVIFGVGYLSTKPLAEAYEYKKLLTNQILYNETRLARDANVGGFVGTGTDITDMRQHDHTDQFLWLAVGSRSPWAKIANEDQKRSSTFAEAALAGATILEVGRQATQADDMEAALIKTGDEVAEALAT